MSTALALSRELQSNMILIRVTESVLGLVSPIYGIEAAHEMTADLDRTIEGLSCIKRFGFFRSIILPLKVEFSKVFPIELYIYFHNKYLLSVRWRRESRIVRDVDC